jgi:orotate phosphoribosyltransferase
LQNASRVLVIEDLITTGGSSVACLAALRDEGLSPVAVLSIFSYGLPYADAAFVAAGTELVSLCRAPDLLPAVAEHPVHAHQVEDLRAWHADEASTFVPAEP